MRVGRAVEGCPGRRHRARGVAGIARDGTGWARLEVATSAGTPVARSEGAPASCDTADLRWLCRTVRWNSPTQVTMVAAVDPYGWRPQGLLTVSTAGDAPPPPRREARFHPPRRPA
ncbi:hypothetical protein [Dactylosporangium sp. NPDC000521]|uniref:hypothetical protein n=1 Tax=Dactylosporangium sp. NPDC000521 TaxID=3363975 RepID=UPI00368FB485